jgi:hypothetical protein
MANRQQRKAWRMAGMLMVAGVVARCSGPTTPTPVPPPGGPAAGARVIVTAVDGWTNRPAAGVQVVIGADTFVGNDDGRVEVPLACEPARVVAPGFLERRVACLSGAIAQGRRPVTLWAVDSDAEREALRAFAFRGDVLVPPGWTQVDILTAAEIRPEAEAVWQRAAHQLREISSGRFAWQIPVRVEELQDGLLVRSVSSVAECDSESGAWAEISGVCRGRYTGPAYPAFISLMLVDGERVLDEAVALRALLYEFGLRPHREPGLFGLTQPAAELSAFERRALHMMSLRGRVSWPDTEF